MLHHVGFEARVPKVECGAKGPQPVTIPELEAAAVTIPELEPVMEFAKPQAQGARPLS